MKTVELRSRGAGSLISLLILAAGAPAQAATYNDGGTHTVSGSDSNDVVSNGTTVNVVPGATVTGMNMDPGGFDGISVSGSTSALNVTGGTITGGSGSHGGGDAAFGQSGNFNISGGSFAGGSSSGTSSGELGGNGADFSGYQSLSISGGMFQGGTGYTGQDGYGLQITGGSATAMISGGTFGGGEAGSLHLAASVVADLGGVTFTTGALSEGSSVANVSGNVADNPMGAPLWTFQDNAVLNLSSGIVSPQLNLLGNAQANITGGEWYCAGFNNNSVVNVSGGQAETEITMANNSIFNLSGGTFYPYTTPPNFYLMDSSVLNVYGTGLMLTYLGGALGGGSEYQLTGTLANGTPLPSDLEIAVHNSAQVNLIQTPEPSALALAALAFLALAGWSRRRQATGSPG